MPNPTGAKFQDQFDAVIKKGNATRKVNVFQAVKATFSIQGGYMTFAVSSFVLMLVFGAMSIPMETDCFVQDYNPAVRCCKCLPIQSVNETLSGQTNLKSSWRAGKEFDATLWPSALVRRSDNNVFYGIVMIWNSLFGLYYLYSGVKQENKYLLFCMVATQCLEVARGFFDIHDTWKDPNYGSRSLDIGRTAVMTVAGLLMLAGFAFLRPMYKSFGWAIFRRGGTKRSVLKMYKLYQRYRAMNQLDVQSAFILFLVFMTNLRYVQSLPGMWVFPTMFICDVMASRYFLKYLKRESLPGVIIAVVAKVFVIGWWLFLVTIYMNCFNDYLSSLQATSAYFTNATIQPYVPDLMSIFSNYKANYYPFASSSSALARSSCLAPNTVHDARTRDVILLNLAQALVFRIGSLIVAIPCIRNFRRGLRDVFYKRPRRRVTSSTANEEALVDDDDQAMATNGNMSERRPASALPLFKKANASARTNAQPTAMEESTFVDGADPVPRSTGSTTPRTGEDDAPNGQNGQNGHNGHNGGGNDEGEDDDDEITEEEAKKLMEW